MITFLVDHNIEGQARILLDAVAAQGWLDLFDTYRRAGRVYIP